MSESAFAQLVTRMAPGSALLNARMLTGGYSAQITLLHVAHPDGSTQKLIVRQHGAVDLSANPNIAADEYHLLATLHMAGIAVPHPLYVDANGDLFETPVIVVEYVEGETIFHPTDARATVEGLAAQLAHIHRLDAAALGLDFLPQQAAIYAEKFTQRPAPTDDSLDEGRIRDTLEPLWPLPPRNRPAILHRDFWPGNVLWQDDRLAAVIDWEDAGIGDPLEDLANTRLEILWAYGEDAMHHFTCSYLPQNPIDTSDLPYWDLLVALRPAHKLADWAADAPAEARMRERHHAFVQQAYAALGESAP
jgi:aminoglycoside phosphotransferase (APT) family kinase protein